MLEHETPNLGLGGAPTPITIPLILDFLEWLRAAPRTYADVMEGWRTSCPRLTIWEDAVDGGYVVRRTDPRCGVIVEVTPLGRRLMSEAGRTRSA